MGQDNNRSSVALGRPHSSSQHGFHVRVEGMLGPQLARLMAERDMDILIPLGALEHHGPHLPLTTDTIITDSLAGAAAQEVGDMLVAPCLPIGCSDHHLGFVGTASIPKEVVSGYVQAVVVSFLSYGFRHAYVVSGHIGNIPAMEAALKNLPMGMRERTAAYLDWSTHRDKMHRWAREMLKLEPELVGSHAGHSETSMMLHLVPELVDAKVAPVGFIGSPEEGSKLLRERGMQHVSKVGVIGDPRSATADAGLEYFKVMIEALVGFIQNHRMERK